MKIPNTWTMVSFTSIFDINGGTQPPKEDFIYEPKEGYIRLLQIRDFGEKPVPTYIPRVGNLRICSSDDILIARYGASIGRIVTGQEGAYNVALAKVNIPESIEKRYVWWLLKSPLFQQFITSFQRTAQNGFNKEDLKGIFVPIAPLAEQKRIVAKLDEAFKHLETLKAKLERIPELLKKFRQTVLTHAVTGRLTEEWRKGKELEEWKEVSLSQLLGKRGIFDGPFGSNLKTADYTDEGIRVIRLENIEHLGFVDGKESFISEEKYQTLLQHTVGEGDILFSSFISENIRVCILPALPTRAIAKADCFCIRPNLSQVNKKFLLYCLASSTSYCKLVKEIHGSTRPRVNTSQLKALTIPLPPLSEQELIVEIIEQVFLSADKLKTRYELLIEKIDKLPKALLTKAFRGELVPQEESDKSAIELLERIEIGEKE